MALYLPIRAFNRSQQVRIGRQKISPTATSYIDVSDAAVRKEFSYHSAIGSVFAVGPLTDNNSDVIVHWGAATDEGADNSDLIVHTGAGELYVRSTGTYVDVAATDSTLSAAHGTLVRIDIIQVNTTTGVVTKKNGTAAASPVAATPDAGNIAIASINVPATDTAITNNQITDVRPR